MAEKPILMSGPMVRALLDGRKTQTRRVVKLREPHLSGDVRFTHIFDSGHRLWAVFESGTFNTAYPCPYGVPGDRLWVRETWYPAFRRTEHSSGAVYRADYGHRLDLVKEWNPSDGWTPSIHMPRWASRLTLEIVSVRVERLNNISEADAIEEGVTMLNGLTAGYLPEDDAKRIGNRTYIRGFANLWNSINGLGAWALNPWVWVIEFTVAPPPPGAQP